MPFDPPLDFGLYLPSVRARLALLAYFNTIDDIAKASMATDYLITLNPPSAFVSVAGENAEANRLIGAHSQRINVELSVLFALAAQYAEDDEANDEIEQVRRAVIRQLIGWQPEGGEAALNYRAYRLVSFGDGLLWGEVVMTGSYRLSAP